MTTEAKLREIFEDILEVPADFDPELTREKYEKWDSLANVNLLMAINDEFGPVMALEQLLELKSFSQILAFLEKKA